MSLTIDLDPDVEASLRREAERLGLEPQVYAGQLIQSHLPAPTNDAPGSWEDATADEWKKAFRAFLARSAATDTTPVIPAEALRRENLYEDRG